MTRRETAEALGITEDQVRQAERRAARSIREVMEAMSVGIDVLADALMDALRESKIEEAEHQKQKTRGKPEIVQSSTRGGRSPDNPANKRKCCESFDEVSVGRCSRVDAVCHAGAGNLDGSQPDEHCGGRS